MKKALVIIISLVVVMVLAVILAPKLISLDSSKAKIAAMVKESTGRELRIGGDIRLSIFPNLEFFAGDIHLANAPGMKEPAMLSIGSVSGKFRLLPLLSNRVVVDSFVIREPSINLEVDKNGQANWVFEKKGTVPSGSASQPAKGAGGEGRTLNGLSLGEVEISKGNFSYIDARTGQIIRAQETSFSVLLADLGSPLTLKMRSNLNDQPVKVDLSVDSLKNFMEGLPAKVDAALASKFVNTGYQGSVQQKPVPGLHGAFNLDIPSVGQLAAWLGQPLDSSQPDPGPLKIQATFEGEGVKVALREAIIEGDMLKARATGSYDGSGDIAKLALNVESEALDIDRYLPPPTPATKIATAPKVQKSATPSRDPLAAISEQPFDLGCLKKTDANIKIDIGGIKAMGYKIGQIAFAATLKDGLLSADLNELKLYGGEVKGSFKLDASGTDLGVDGLLTIAGVKVDELAQTSIGDTIAVNGTADGKLTVKGKGSSPKGLVQNISAKGYFKLGGFDLKNSQVGSISGIHLGLDLPGADSQSSVQASLVYNKEKVDLTLTMDSISKALAGKVFAVKTVLDSKHLNLTYNGSAHQQPAPVLDGKLSLDVSSVARLMQWLDQPLGSDQPDPGSLAVRATIEAEGSKVALKEATIEGKAILVQASASLDNSGSIPALVAKVSVEKADLDAYLPPAEQKKSTPKKQPQEKTAKQESSGWSEEPLDLSGLSKANADILLEIVSLHYRDITIQPGRIKAVLKNGVLEAALEEVQVADGVINSTVKLDGSGESLGLDYQLTISGLEARPFLQTFAGTDRLSGQTAFETKGALKGRNQKELVSSLQGDGNFKFQDGAIHGVNIAGTLRKAKSLGFSSEDEEEVKTDFAELSGSFVITDGVVVNQDLKMLAPLLKLDGSGQVPLPQRTVTYNLTAELVATLEGQGRKDSLSGLPIPIEIDGPWDGVSYKVNWGQVFGDLAADPTRLQNLPQNLRDAGSDFGVNLSVPGLTDKDAGANLLNQLLPTKKETTDTTTKPDQPEEPEAIDPAKVLKGLFGR